MHNLFHLAINDFLPQGPTLSGYGKWSSQGTRATQCSGVLLGYPVSGGKNTETWSSRLGVVRGTDNLTL
jgi:hypothetical protein